MKLYDALTPWYRLVDPPEDHLDEATAYGDALERGAVGPVRTMLELGSGGGHNALYLKRRFHCTLTDLSPAMLALNRELNPECEHIQGDMRTLRLERQFDAVLVHDAVVYMTTEQDLAAAARTAFVHTRPGGSAVFAPDFVRETFADTAQLLQGDAGDRALRGLEWSWDPSPDDCTYQAEYTLLLRMGDTVEAVHDRHTEGLFPRATWIGILSGAGYEVELMERPLDEERMDQVFLCRRLGDAQS